MDLLANEISDMISRTVAQLRTNRKNLERSKNKIKQEENRHENLKDTITRDQARLKLLPIFEAIAITCDHPTVKAMVSPQLVWVDMTNSEISGPAVTVVPRNPEEERLPGSLTSWVDNDEYPSEDDEDEGP